MIWALVGRGMAAGLLAGLLAGAFAFIFGEPLVAKAIEIEEAASALASASPVPVAHIADWVVDRDEQRVGLFLATALYGIAVGGLFALAFAVLRGRGAERGDWQLATRLAGTLFVAIVLVPFVKYPPNPPGVGDPATIGARTEYYLILLGGSLLALVAAARVVWSVRAVARPWMRPLAGAGTFVALTGGLALALPAVNEVPAQFPASLLWEFRLSSLGTQAVLWTALGLGFGIMLERAADRPMAG
jgi:hypothetical protein